MSQAPLPVRAVDAQQLVAAVARLSHLATQDFPIPTMLRALAQAAAECLDIDGAGVMRRVEDRNVFEHSHGAYALDIRPLEQLQEALQAGPCAEAIASGSVIVSHDLAHDGRWADFQQLAAQLQVGSMVAVPLISRGRGWGVLDLYRQEPRRWTAEELEAAQVLADLAVSYLVMASDRDGAHEAKEELSHRAMHDDLTGLPNRAMLFDHLQRTLAATEHSRAGVAVVFLDLDLFKRVNDTFGHFAADDVLVEVSRRLGGALRDNDTLARFAGDEFVIVCEGLPQDEPEVLSRRVASLASRLQRVLQAPIRVEETDVVVSASVGAAIAYEPMTGQELLANADSAMYTAKSRGPGRVSIRDGVAVGAIADSRRLEHELMGALDRGELAVHYQSIVHAGTHDLAAVEALLRWERPEHGTVPAGSFVDIAARTGLIVTIGRWVIAQACQQMAAWQRDLPSVAPRTVYINLSAHELADEGLLDAIDLAFVSTGLSPEQVGFEIVEEDLADLAAATRLSELQKRGHPLSIDDFGTGYSSLSRLLDLPATVAKLDRSIVDKVPEDVRRIRFIDGVLHVAGTLDLQVVAEGVETWEQAEHLFRAGCPLLQGYFIARPQPADELAAAWALAEQVVEDDGKQRLGTGAEPRG